jgi:hypothetical protein
MVTDFFPSRSPALPFQTAKPTEERPPGENGTPSGLEVFSRRWNKTRYEPVE